MYVNINGTWKEAKDIYVNINGVWKTAYNVYVNINGTWREMPRYFNATGGTITTDGDYRIHKFTSNGTFSVLYGGEITSLSLVGGGGGGGYYSDNDQLQNGGGGGGGYFRKTSFTINAGNYSIVVGGGGSVNRNGGNSTALGYTAYGGGRGGTIAANGGDGGCGGGACYYKSIGIGSQGGNGIKPDSEDYFGAGSGGGAGGSASNSGYWLLPGPGVYIPEVNATFSVGGMGANIPSQYTRTTQAANSGNGGNAYQHEKAPTAGASGIVVIKYKYK